MNAVKCEGVSDLIEPFADGELVTSEAGTVERHLQDCAACRQELAKLRSLHDEIRSLPRHVAPPRLAERIRRSLSSLEAQQTESWKSSGVPIATHLCAALLGIALSYFMLTSATQHEELTRELIAAHVRSLMQERPTDVTSGDPHRIGPWFAGKLDFAPKARDLAVQGFPLEGARVDYVQGRRVAALVFRRRAHVINVFVSPSAAGPLPRSEWRGNGYNLVRWANSDFAFSAISDLNAQELGEFTALLDAK